MSRVAIVDDEVRLGRVLGLVLKRAGHQVETFTSGPELLDSDQSFDCVLTDLRMPGMDGVELLAALKERDPTVPVVLITAHGSVSSAVQAMKLGAFDYLQKPVENEACRAVVAKALAHSRLHRENRWLRTQTDDPTVVAVSEGMTRVLALARRAARSTATVLIQGPSGSGKEVVARTVHVHSPRGDGPFEAVNCKALAAGVLESELFGHEKGAYTGAHAARPGLFERASGGTVFLDELGEIDAAFQAKLLRVLQESEVQRVGADRPRPIDVRVVAATNRDLRSEVAAGRFREDLYFRLAVVPIHVPPLVERRADVLPLARHFLKICARQQGRTMSGWTDEVERWLGVHTFPGNVRELRNHIERGVVLAESDVITMGDLLLDATPSEPTPRAGSLAEALDQTTRARVQAALRASAGRRAEAAAALGIERTTLYRLMRRLGIETG